MLVKNYSSWEDQPIFQRLLFLFHKKLLGALMKRGLRFQASRRLHSVFLLLKRRLGVSPVLLLLVAFLRMAPEVHLKGSPQRPYVAPVKESQKITLAVRWFLAGSSGTPQRLAEALQEAAENRGSAVELKKKTYDQASIHKHRSLTYKKS